MRPGGFFKNTFLFYLTQLYLRILLIRLYQSMVRGGLCVSERNMMNGGHLVLQLKPSVNMNLPATRGLQLPEPVPKHPSVELGNLECTAGHHDKAVLTLGLPVVEVWHTSKHKS